MAGSCRIGVKTHMRFLPATPPAWITPAVALAINALLRWNGWHGTTVGAQAGMQCGC
jgi:hypothetical protein